MVLALDRLYEINKNVLPFQKPTGALLIVVTPTLESVTVAGRKKFVADHTVRTVQ